VPYSASSHVAAKVRRARFGPGLRPGPRRQARWVGRGLRRSRVGPEDRFCEAVRNDLRVPLTLEGPTRTMRGVPARYPVTSLWRSAQPARRHRPGRGAGGRGSGIRRGPQAAGHRGAVRGSRRAAGLASEGRGESCRPATARLPGEPRAPTAGHPRRSYPPTARPVLATHGLAVRPGAPEVRP
jgi:hypothetical protein